MTNSDLQGGTINWSNDAAVTAATAAYREWALRIVRERQLIRHNIMHPWRNPGNSEFLIEIYELERGRVDLTRPSTNEIINYFKSTTPTTKSVILLQDMAADVFEVLGTRLGIPPHFFLAHCGKFSDLRVIDNTYTAQNSNYWKVPVPRTCKVPPPIPNGEYSMEAGNFSRGLFDVTSQPQEIEMRNYVSYWGKTYGPDSWTAVILMDSSETGLRSLQEGLQDSENGLRSSQEGLQNRHLLNSIPLERSTLYEVMVGGVNSAESNDQPQPTHRKMFQAAVEAYNQIRPPNNNDPFTGTMFVRNLIRSTWEEKIIRSAQEFRDNLVRDREKYQKMHENKSNTGKDFSNSYSSMMIHRQETQEVKRNLASIMWKFRCMDPDEASYTENELTGPDQVQGTRLQKYLTEERRAWKILYEISSDLESSAAEQMEMWSQRAAFAQTAAANKLTIFATIIVPSTVVASIFSMQGDFEAGKGGYFWIYWAISVPITIIILLFVLRHDIPDAWHKTRKVFRKVKEDVDESV